MFPVLINIGPVKIYSFGLFLVLSYLTFSFVFWRILKNEGVTEEKIFDTTFTGMLISAVTARLTFVIFHWTMFSDYLLKVAALWVVPGLSYYGALFGFIFYIMFFSKKIRVRLNYLLEALAYALPASYIVLSVGSFLDGTVIGKVSGIPVAVQYSQDRLLRHPVQLYEIMVMALFLIILPKLHAYSAKKKYVNGIIGIWYFMYFTLVEFILEFLKESSVYWAGLTVNQWVAVAVFGESIGLLYVKSGGVNMTVRLGRSFAGRVSAVTKNVYDKFTVRFTKRRTD